MVPIREPKTYSIFLADELTLVREGLAALCEAPGRGRPLFKVVGQCSEGAVAQRMIESTRPDIDHVLGHRQGLGTLVRR